jgi:hypothetical protein
MLHIHEEQDLLCFYDRIKQIALVSYRNHVTPEIVAKADKWLSAVRAMSCPLHSILCDVRSVRRFDELKAFEANGDLPVVFITVHPYQKLAIQKNISDAQSTSSYEEAFKLLDVLENQANHPYVLNSEGASLYYDKDRHILSVIYYGSINPAVTADAYATGAAIIGHYGLDIRGSIFEFRHVIDFDNSNLNAVRRTSGSLNTNYDMNHIAVALLVGTMMQESMVRMVMKITPQEERKRIVHSYEDCYQFIDNYHLKRAAKAAE